MAEAAVGAAVQVLVQNLLSMFSEEIKLVRGFNDGLAKFKDSLTMIQKLLSDAEKKEIKDDVVKEWLKQLEDVAFEADDVMDELNYHLLRQKLKNKVLRSFSSGSTSLLFRRRIIHKIKDVNKKLDAITNAPVTKSLQEVVLSAHDASSSGSVETDSFSVESYVIGREDDAARIIEMIVNAPSDEALSVIPVVGMGGLGKTTLARKIFHDVQMTSHFEKKIWVCVSFDFDDVNIFQAILKTLTGEDVQGTVIKEVVLEKIRKVLERTRYLLVLDDIWNEEFQKWEGFIRSLSGISNVKQNVIIVTTRKENVASIVQTLPVYWLGSMSSDDCWSIIKAKALSRVDDPLEFEEIGKSIAQQCRGLPLAANIVGGLMRGKPRDEWSSILENQLSNFGRDENPVMKILKLSYDRLPSSSLKRCFAYCSIFPQDFEIEKETIIELWMAEGFLQANQENDLEIAGYSVFNHLLQTSLIQDTKRDNFGNITHCRMHDLVHDLACSVSGSRSANLIDSRNDTNKVRYLNLESNELYCISKERAKYLRTLIFSGKVAENFFSGFNCLHALTLADSDTEELPIGIDKQVHLRFLDISSTRIKYLPDSICKLSNLQTLIVPKTLEKLPRTIIELLNLKHLHISSMMLPPRMGKLTSLRTLPYYNVDHYPGCRIGELGNLKNLKGKLSIENLERVNNKEEATQADMYGKRNISKLVLVWDKSRRGETNDESVLEGLQPHPNLKSLEIDGYRGRNFPSWTMRMAVYDVVEGRLVGLTNLIEIKLHHCHQCKEVPSLGHLPRLKFLEINDLQYLQSIGPSFYGLEDCNPSSRTVFPALEKLSLSELRYLSEWADVESRVVAFPCLEDLEIISCPQLKGAPTHFPCLKRLRIYQMANDSCLKNICTNTSHLQQLEINTDWGTTCLPEELFVKNQELSYLNIRSCSKLTGLVLYLRGGGSSLQELNLYDCPNLKKLPEDLNTLQSLQRLQIRNCPGLTSFGQCQGLTSLRELEITNFGGLIDFPFEFLESCSSSLETLRLHGLESWDTVMNLPISLGRLRHLQISGLSKSWDVVSLNNILKCILYENRSLVWLDIGGNEDWESLPDQVQHLTALQTLILTNFGFEALPEWIGNISSLEFLSVWNCKRLRRMPYKEAMQRRTKLFIQQR